MQKTQTYVFVQNRKKKRNGNVCILCHNFLTNQNLDQLSTSKWPSEPQFCERWTYIWQKMAGNGRNIVIYQYLSFPIRLYLSFSTNYFFKMWCLPYKQGHRDAGIILRKHTHVGKLVVNSLCNVWALLRILTYFTTHDMKTCKYI